MAARSRPSYENGRQARHGAGTHSLKLAANESALDWGIRIVLGLVLGLPSVALPINAPGFYATALIAVILLASVANAEAPLTPLGLPEDDLS